VELWDKVFEYYGITAGAKQSTTASSSTSLNDDLDYD